MWRVNMLEVKAGQMVYYRDIPKNKTKYGKVISILRVEEDLRERFRGMLIYYIAENGEKSIPMDTVFQEEILIAEPLEVSE